MHKAVLSQFTMPRFAFVEYNGERNGKHAFWEDKKTDLPIILILQQVAESTVNVKSEGPAVCDMKGRGS